MTQAVLIAVVGGIPTLTGGLLLYRANMARLADEHKAIELEAHNKSVAAEREEINEKARQVEETRVNNDKQTVELSSAAKDLRTELNTQIAELKHELQLSDEKCAGKLALLSQDIEILKASYAAEVARHEETRQKWVDAEARAAKWEARAESQIVTATASMALAQSAKDIATDVDTKIKGGSTRP